MFQQIGFLRVLIAAKRHLENGYRLVEPSARAEITDGLAGLENPCIISLMAPDTNIVCQPKRKFSRIDYGVVRQTRSLPCTAFSHVQVTRTVAVFTTDSRLCEWLLRKGCRAPYFGRK